MSGILRLVGVDMRGIIIDENLHPTVESVCAGCEDVGTNKCDGKSCRMFLNPAGK